MSRTDRRAQGFGFLVAVVLAVVTLAPQPATWFPEIAPFWLGAKKPFGPIVLGCAIVVVYWALSTRRRETRNEETVDSVYFLGFVLTLVYLMFGLVATEEAGASDKWVLGFIGDLGIGLIFTICGLTLRQIGALTGPNLEAAPQPATTGSVGAESAERSVHPGDQHADDSEEGGARSQRDAAEVRIQRSYARLTRANRQLAAKTIEVAGQMDGAMSQLRTTLDETLNTLRIEAANALKTVTQTALDAKEAQHAVTDLTRQQLAVWIEEVKRHQADIVAVRAVTEHESHEALEALRGSSEAIVELCDKLVERMNQLPDPSDRLKSLWGTISEQERQMTESIRVAGDALRALRADAGTSGAALHALATTAGDGAEGVAEGARLMHESLTREAEAMRRIVDDLYGALERRIGSIGR